PGCRMGSEVAAQGRIADVGIDQQRFRAGDGIQGGEVARDRALAFPRQGRGDADAAHRPRLARERNGCFHRAQAVAEARERRIEHLAVATERRWLFRLADEAPCEALEPQQERLGNHDAKTGNLTETFDADLVANLPALPYA